MPLKATATTTPAVVVAVLDAADCIDECVGSLLAQSIPADVIVVDNGSTDGTLDRLARYGDAITLGKEARRGPGAARNAGLRLTGADVVAFTDSDCRAEPDWLERLIEPLADPSVGIAGGTIRARPPANRVELFGDRIHDHRQAIEVFDPPYAITMNWASRRAVLEELGGFDEGFRRCEDVDLSYRVAQAGYRLAFAPEAVVYHRNERNLAGLFGEGFAHGYHGVLAAKQHERYLRGFGHRRVSLASFAQLGRSRCDAAFGVGKKAGKLAGSVRFRHLEL